MKIILAIASLLCVALGLSAQTGTWHGELNIRGTKLPLVFHLDRESPTLDSPAQGVKGLPINVAHPATDSLSVDIPMVRASFSGRYAEGKISGTFSQSGMSLPLTLVCGDAVVRRPQTPVPPFPYSQEEVSFANGDAVLSGTLTLPEGFTENTPVVIMITGSGLQNRDEEIFDHKPFAVISDALARAGIASLRYDDRGFGKSTGDAINCTTEDLKLDALAGIESLRTRFNKVGALGHSEGGTIALMLGADRKVDFVISLAGMVVSGKETLLEQNRFLLSMSGYPQQVVDEYCNILAMIFNGDPSASKELESSNLPADLKKNLKAVEIQVATPYMQYLLTSDPRDILGSVHCPVLALNGKKDTQVFSDSNLDALRRGLPANPANKIEALEGLNHLFQHCTTGVVSEYATIEETVSPEVLAIMSQWINKSIK